MIVVEISDGLHNHPKVLAAGNAAVGLWVRALSYSGAFQTNGIITTGMLRRLGARHQDCQRLVDAALWVEQPDGSYRIEPDDRLFRFCGRHR